jgi:hypothetical protein
MFLIKTSVKIPMQRWKIYIKTITLIGQILNSNHLLEIKLYRVENQALLEITRNRLGLTNILATKFNLLFLMIVRMKTSIANTILEEVTIGLQALIYRISK